MQCLALGAASLSCLPRLRTTHDIIGHMEPIAYIRTDLPQKFGIPRNSFLAPHLQGRVVFRPQFANNAAVTGLEDFSHIWLLWQFQNGAPGGTAADIVADSAEAANAALNSSNALANENDGESDANAAHKTAKESKARILPRTANAEATASTADAASMAAMASTGAATWSATVRPPRLGGSERKGVFATRSPFRPNPIGLTCVKLDRVELTDEGPVLHVLGADLRDGTPIFDIKPYIPFADCHPDATGGWIDDAPWHELAVNFPEELRPYVPAGKLAGLVEVLAQDPRRAGSKHEPTRVYHLAYAGLNVAFTVDGDTLTVVDVSR